MKSMKKIGFIGIVQLICVVLACVVALPIIYTQGLLIVEGSVQIILALRWVLFFYILFMLISTILFSHKYAQGKAQELLFFLSSTLVISLFLSFVIFSLVRCKFDFNRIDWLKYVISIIALDDWLFYGIVAIVAVAYTVIYATLINKRLFDFFGKGGLIGSGKLKQLEDTNLENSRWMNKEERDKIFKVHKFSKLGSIKKDGIPVMAKLSNKDKDMDVAFNSPCHSIIIGSTGSGKTTTFVSPMIQLLGASGAGSSMVITDPKGELFSLHSKFLKSRGYDVKVIDLRDTYASYRWNPLDSIWDAYESYRLSHKRDAFAHTDSLKDSKLELADPEETFSGKWYEFHGKAYSDYNHLVEAIKIYKKKTFDEVYEDLNDLCSILIPVENEKDPMWEKGARSIVLATLIAMLEDSGDPRLNMTKEKFNFFNMAKILQNSSKDYEELRNYFKGRNPLSKALALSKQVCDAATQTRASYMSIVYEKLTMFNDAGICALTSASDIRSEGLAERPTCLFLKIPDEKDTRHNLAAIFILNIYKTLIKVASATEELTLPRNVYFIMDEFGNMPKIEKFDKFITVGRSRKIWFNMIIQSYAQLNNVYGETVADIVKGNCGIKMFIGSNDMGTCKEYSELCGNITVVTSSTSGSSNSKDISISQQTQVRPLIYPSELQRLNHPGDIGHSIIVTFGNYPFKTYFSPSFKVPFYKFGKMDTSDVSERFFDENSIVYSIDKRNNLVLNPDGEQPEGELKMNPNQANGGQIPVQREENKPSLPPKQEQPKDEDDKEDASYNQTSEDESEDESTSMSPEKNSVLSAIMNSDEDNSFDFDDDEEIEEETDNDVDFNFDEVEPEEEIEDDKDETEEEVEEYEAETEEEIDEEDEDEVDFNFDEEEDKDEADFNFNEEDEDEADFNFDEEEDEDDSSENKENE